MLKILNHRVYPPICSWLKVTAIVGTSLTPGDKPVRA